MAPTGRWNRMWFVLVITFVTLLSSHADAARLGGEGVALTRSGDVLSADGSTQEEYEVRESDPITAHFISLGSAAQKLLNKSGYAFGSLVRISHSDRDKEYGEGPERTAWFPMVVFLDVFEEGSGDNGEDMTARYEVALDFHPKTIAAPGLVVLAAWKINTDGGVAAKLDVLPAEEKGFLEKNRPGITMMFGVIIASGIVKFLRRGLERLVKKAKADRQEGTATAAPATEAEPSVAAARGKGAENPKKKKEGGNNVKQD
ncbi:unnamed protein product [Ectocarpus sp. CCAP 1310/34]|nr:unnamed protein product [Ectocarpus sp. CCAP 1310/34]